MKKSCVLLIAVTLVFLGLIATPAFAAAVVSPATTNASTAPAAYLKNGTNVPVPGTTSSYYDLQDSSKGDATYYKKGGKIWIKIKNGKSISVTEGPGDDVGLEIEGQGTTGEYTGDGDGDPNTPEVDVSGNGNTVKVGGDGNEAKVDGKDHHVDIKPEGLTDPSTNNHATETSDAKNNTYGGKSGGGAGTNTVTTANGSSASWGN